MGSSDHCSILDVPRVVLFLLLLGTGAEKQHGRDEAKELDEGEAHANNAYNVEPLHDPQVQLVVAAPLVDEARVSRGGASGAIDKLFQAA